MSRPRANKMPLGDMTPTVRHSTVQAKALQLRNAMADCILSDQVIELVALRVNTGASTAKLAKAVGLTPTQAYVALSRPQAQALMAELARSLMGAAAITAVHTMTTLMRGSDHALAYRAAEQMMERTGLGISQRATPDGAKTNTVFQFAFGAPQAVSPQPQDVAPAIEHARMGPGAAVALEKDPPKTGHAASGEALSPAISEPGHGQNALSPVILQSVTAQKSAPPPDLKSSAPPRGSEPRPLRSVSGPRQ